MYNIIIQIGNLLLSVIDIYRILLIVYFLMSWLPGAYQSRIGQFLIRICEPYVAFFRQFIPPIGMISIAGLVALFALSLIKTGLVAVIQFLAMLFI